MYSYTPTYLWVFNLAKSISKLTRSIAFQAKYSFGLLNNAPDKVRCNNHVYKLLYKCCGH